MLPAVSELFVYPIKSLGGIRVDSARVVERGFEHDRRFMVVDGRGEFVTQRSHPRLARVKTRIGDGSLVLTRPGASPLELPLEPPDGPGVAVVVWQSVCDAVPVSADADRWLSELIGIPCRLVHMPERFRRPVEAPYARGDEVVSFADGFPFLLIEQASLDDLNARLARPLPMNRFRPNVVVAGTGPFAAGGWSRIRIRGVAFRVAKPCARCVVTTVDQATGETDGEGSEPLRTLATYRRGAGGVLFGENLIHEGVGELRVGDAVEVMERREA